MESSNGHIGEPCLKMEHTDARGAIYSIDLPGNREIMLLHSLKGSMRGGHNHSCDEIVVLLTGKMRYAKKAYPGSPTSIQTLSPGESSFNKAGEMHMAEFLEDSWVMECKLAEKGSWTQENDPKMRALVEASI